MKKSLLALCAFLSFSLVSKGQSVFSNVENMGFDGDNGSVKTMVPFKGKLYAGMGNSTAQIYRSATGDAGTFTNVYADTVLFRYYAVDHFAVTGDGGGYLYAALEGVGGGGKRYIAGDQGISGIGTVNSKVMRSADGLNWEDYYEVPVVGFNTCRVSSITMFKGTGTVDSVYITYKDPSDQTHIIRNAIDANDYINSATWQEVANLSTLFGDMGDVTASVVYNGKLYYATSYNHLYETSDGTTFTENTAFYASMGGGSLSDNYETMSMVVHNSELYLGTGSNSGGKLWKTADGVTFDSLYAHPSMDNVRRMTSAGGKIWMIYAEYQDFEIVSFDGSAATIEESNEFGNDMELEADNNSSITEFDNHLYIGVEHYMGGGKRLPNIPHQIAEMYSNGGQIWRTCLTGTSPSIDIISGADTVVCAGQSVTLVASPGFPAYTWSNGNNTQFLSTITPGYYAVSVVDVNGCRSSAGTTIQNAPELPVIFSDSSNTTQYPAITICEGDSTIKLKAHPEAEMAAFHYYAQSKGLTTPQSGAFAARQLTVEMWVRPDNNTGVIMTEYDTASWSFNNHDMIEYWSGTLYFELPDVPEVYIGDIPANQWSHVVLVYDGANLSGYINGTPYGSGGGTWLVPPSGYDGFKIGYPADNSDYGASPNNTGFVRDVRIWNVARTNQEIIDNMNGLLPGTYPNLVYHYELEDGSGTVAHDSSGNANDAVVTGTFVTPQVVNVTPSTGLTSYGDNYFRFDPVTTTTYTATYTNSTGCLVSTPFTITVPHVDFTGSFPSQCGSADAQLALATAGSYTWTPSVVDYGTYVSPDPQPTVSSWYHVEMFAADGGCHLFDSIYVNVGPAFVSNVTPPVMMSACEDADVTIDVMASGGTAPYTYYWHTFGQTEDDTTYVDSLTFLMPAGSSVTVSASGKDAIGCPLTPAPSFSISPTASTDLHGHISTPPPSSMNVDNGFVYVFKHQPGQAGYDTVGYTNLDGNGDYLFSPLTAGPYLIKVLPDPVAFPDAVPTYFGNAFQWDSSIVYIHGCSQVDTADIQIVVASPDTGSASISGYILEGLAFGDTTGRYGNIGQPNLPFAPGGPLKGIDVKLGKNPGGGIQARTMSDSTGFYIFDSIPVGGYKIYVDIPNLPMDSTRELQVMAGDSSIQNNYFADSASIYINPDTVNMVGIYSSDKVYNNKFSIYPNPAKDVLYLNFELEKEGKVAFEITNVFGQRVRYDQPRRHPAGKNIFIMPIDQLHLSGGVYFISILNESKKYTQRVVVIE